MRSELQDYEKSGCVCCCSVQNKKNSRAQILMPYIQQVFTDIGFNGLHNPEEYEEYQN